MAALLELKKISRRCGAVQALKDFSFEVEAGEIVGLVGENGAGKTTCMNIAYGIMPADFGEIFWQGQKTYFRSPAEARTAGLGMVHQHFALSLKNTVLENILVSMPGGPLSFLKKTKTRAELKTRAAELGFEDFPWDQAVEDLSIGQQQRVEIFKALLHRPRLLILDEPTAVLTPQEVQSLFVNLKAQKAAGTSVVIITHKLKEIMQITDRVYVIRGGQNAVQAKTAEMSIGELASAMIGRKSTPSRFESALSSEKLNLKITDLKVNELGHNLDIPRLHVFDKETVGIAGVEGNGQDLLIRALLTPRELPDLKGQIEFQGRALHTLPTAQILKSGLRALPEDRLRFGALPEQTSLENFALGHQAEFSKWGRMDWQGTADTARKTFEEFDVRPPDIGLTFKKFSGGNQQKIVVAREVFHQPKLLIAAHPTRGVDLNAADFIRRKIKDVAASGSVLLISSDLDELFQMCDRILVMYKGRIQKEFTKAEFGEDAVGAAMAGVGP